MTQDVDFVVDPRGLCEHVDAVVVALSISDLMFDESTLRTAVQRRGMFQLLDTRESLKLDVYAEN